jgi:ABC-type bacteriocin/lantibiotic exporter with double-glycine peptidase domain
VILIAHRPEVWALADRIYELDDTGRLTEATPPLQQAS